MVNQLSSKVVGLTVTGFRSEWKKSVRPSFSEFQKRMIGTRIAGVRRFGKHIVIDCSLSSDEERAGVRLKKPSQRSSGEISKEIPTPSQPPPQLRGRGIRYSIVIHLKMTGHLLVKTKENEHEARFQSENDPYNGYIRHVIDLSNDTRIEFSDLRKFGWLEVVLTSEVEQLKSIKLLGIDALSRAFTLKKFQEILEKKPKSKIGALLLEQNCIAGVGNIYRNEALFRAGILPMRRSESLERREREALYKAIRTVLREAVELRGLSDGDFRDTDGRPGGFQERAFVYGRAGLPCKKCGTIIKREKLGTRSVFFCSKCQR